MCDVGVRSGAAPLALGLESTPTQVHTESSFGKPDSNRGQTKLKTICYYIQRLAGSVLCYHDCRKGAASRTPGSALVFAGS
jgi:hypothetical protein